MHTPCPNAACSYRNILPFWPRTTSSPAPHALASPWGPHIGGGVVGLLEGESGTALGAQLQPLPLEPLDGWFGRQLFPIQLGHDHSILSWEEGKRGGNGESGRRSGTLVASGHTPLRPRSPQTPTPSSPRRPSPVSTDTESGFFRKTPVGSSAVGDWSSGGASAQEIRSGVGEGGLRRAGKGVAGHFGGGARANDGTFFCSASKRPWRQNGFS